ncbi:hypothetical protein VTK26DRAFT_2865 [Humicola hyalothermophila]
MTPLEKDRSRHEDSVNMALLLLLDVTTICSGIQKEKGRQGLTWLATRQSFRLGSAGNSLCEARTDGLLVMDGPTPLTLAILEVKPYRRTSDQFKIEWQEACQMAAWISSSLREEIHADSTASTSPIFKEQSWYIVVWGVRRSGMISQGSFLTLSLLQRRLFFLLNDNRSPAKDRDCPILSPGLDSPLPSGAHSHHC